MFQNLANFKVELEREATTILRFTGDRVPFVWPNFNKINVKNVNEGQILFPENLNFDISYFFRRTIMNQKRERLQNFEIKENIIQVRI